MHIFSSTVFADFIILNNLAGELHQQKVTKGAGVRGRGGALANLTKLLQVLYLIK